MVWSRWQVFGLADTRHVLGLTYQRLLPGPGTQCVYVPPSFPLTAAGQLRILTGFPLAIPEDTSQCRGETNAGQNYHSNAQTSHVD